MMATWTAIQPSRIAPAPSDIERARRELAKTAIAAASSEPPTTTKRIALGMK